jgi:putative SOS response-associated peptidase YedK
MTRPQAEIRHLVRATLDNAGNVPALAAIFPDRLAPVVRDTPDGRELVMMRWGFPPPGKGRVVTNVRNTASRWWRPWLSKPAHRCLVPVTSFCEPDNRAGDDQPSVWTWFAQDETRPLMFFAGIWREWDGTRGTKAATAIGRHLLFSFLTADPSEDVKHIHDATPALLLDEAARETWLNAPIEEALQLQHPPPTGALRVVKVDSKSDD